MYTILYGHIGHFQSLLVTHHHSSPFLKTHKHCHRDIANHYARQSIELCIGNQGDLWNTSCWRNRMLEKQDVQQHGAVWTADDHLPVVSSVVVSLGA